MEWFYRNLFGRIIQRTNKDQDDMDGTINNYICYFFTNLFLIIGTTVYIVIAMPPFIVVVVFIFILYYFVINKYLTVSREIKRIEVMIYCIFRLLRECLLYHWSVRLPMDKWSSEHIRNKTTSLPKYRRDSINMCRLIVMLQS